MKTEEYLDKLIVSVDRGLVKVEEAWKILSDARKEEQHKEIVNRFIKGGEFYDD